LYTERYPRQRLPNQRLFHAIHCRITEACAVHPSTVDRRRLRRTRKADVEKRFLRRVEENPSSSTSSRTSSAHESTAGFPRTLAEPVPFATSTRLKST
jgi:hypothetical protein